MWRLTTLLALVAQIKGMSEKDLARTWTLYVKELAVLLLATEGQEAPSEVLSRIQTLVQRELLFLYFQCALRLFGTVNRLSGALLLYNFIFLFQRCCRA